MSNDPKPAGHEPTGFPIQLEPDVAQSMVDFRSSRDGAAEELLEVNSQIEALQRRARALHDVIQHADTGSRILLRAHCSTHGIDENEIGLKVNVETGEATLVNNAAPPARPSRR